MESGSNYLAIHVDINSSPVMWLPRARMAQISIRTGRDPNIMTLWSSLDKRQQYCFCSPPAFASLVVSRGSNHLISAVNLHPHLI